MSREDSRRLRALFEMATDGIITIDDEGFIENVNQAACTLFGYSEREMRGQKVNMLMTQPDRQDHDKYLARYHATRTPHIIGIGREVMGRKKDGTEFPLRLAVSEVKLEDKTIYTGILHDISAFVAAQANIRQLNADLENRIQERTAALRQREEELKNALSKERELNELKSRFLSLASHEFKTPLSTVLSSAELIEMYSTVEQTGKREKHVQRIKDAVHQLKEVLDDFLSLSQLEQGKITCFPRLLDLRAIISTSIENSEGQFKADQEVELDLAEEPRRIVSDPKLLRHILMNLLSNAAKYSPEGSNIVLRTERRGDELAIEVIDQGIGIPVEDQQYLFERFFRAQNVENVKGTGLGLNIVRHYAELLEGRIDFSSTLNRGSTFTVYLPLTDTATTDE